MNQELEIKPSEREIKYFIDIMKATVDYDEIKKVHWCGISILTNNDMNKMCLNRFGNDYAFMTRPEQRKLRERIFRELRNK